MPLKNDKFPPYCITHHDKPMVILNENDAKLLHLINLGWIGNDGYHIIDKGTAMNYYACPKCGYCEAYLVPKELEQIKNT